MHFDSTKKVYAVDFSHWKRRAVKLICAPAKVKFVNSLKQVALGETVLIWGMRMSDSELNGYQVIRVEDGFLRSVGLGVDLIKPLSWVMDTKSIYFNARQASTLEELLLTHDFPPELRSRAKKLREQIVEKNLTKYNVGSKYWQRPSHVKNIVLVVGQVESDASIAYGTTNITRNMDLLRAVWAEQSHESHVVYKPHPDVTAGLRASGAAENNAGLWCHEVVTDMNMSKLLIAVDEVHVLTSLAGFEALLRGKKVVCYGHPFYAGWGLTTDITPHTRRTRRLSLDELVAGSLILYPYYFDRALTRTISPEDAINELINWRETSGVRNPWWREFKRILLRLIVGVK